MDGNGQPKALGLTPGQTADCTVAETLRAEIEAGMMFIADKAYNTDAILDHLAEVAEIAAISSRSDRTEPRKLDPEVYATRNLVEWFFGRIKGFWRVATRYDKRVRNFLSALILATTRYLMRGLARAAF